MFIQVSQTLNFEVFLKIRLGISSEWLVKVRDRDRLKVVFEISLDWNLQPLESETYLKLTALTVAPSG
jgi:hypothetical protein